MDIFYLSLNHVKTTILIDLKLCTNIAHIPTNTIICIHFPANNLKVSKYVEWTVHNYLCPCMKVYYIRLRYWKYLFTIISEFP